MTTDKKLPTPPDGYTWAFEDYEGTKTFTLVLSGGFFGPTYTEEIKSADEAHAAARLLLSKQQEDDDRKKTLATLREMIP